MYVTILFVPVTSVMGISAIMWRIIAETSRFHHWLCLRTSLMIGLIALSVVVARLLMELQQQLRANRASRELAVLQQQYPDFHVTRLPGGRWLLTDRNADSEGRPDAEIVQHARIGVARDAMDILPFFRSKPQIAPRGRIQA